MLQLWIVLGVAVWLVLLTLVIALCAASGRADRSLVEAPAEPRRRAHRPGLHRVTRA